MFSTSYRRIGYDAVLTGAGGEGIGGVYVGRANASGLFRCLNVERERGREGGREGGRKRKRKRFVCVCLCVCVSCACMTVCTVCRLTFLRLLYVNTFSCLEGTEVMGDKRARKVVEAIERGDLVTMRSSRGAGTHLTREDLTLL